MYLLHSPEVGGGGEKGEQVPEVEEGEDQLQSLQIIGDFDENLIFAKPVGEESIQP